jgi:hypothetical protein
MDAGSDFADAFEIEDALKLGTYETKVEDGRLHLRCSGRFVRQTRISRAPRPRSTTRA